MFSRLRDVLLALIMSFAAVVVALILYERFEEIYAVGESALTTLETGNQGRTVILTREQGRTVIRTREEELLEEMSERMEAFSDELADVNMDLRVLRELVQQVEKLQNKVGDVESQLDALSKAVAELEEGKALVSENESAPDGSDADGARDAEPAEPAEREQEAQRGVGDGLSVYIVRRGDTISGIARDKCMSVAELRDLNELRSADEIEVGQELLFREDACATP